MKPFVCWLAAFLSVAVSALQVRAELPNMVWINAEDMSPHLGCYGHPDAITPNIDALARDGIVYRQAFATAPICSPSRSCLATGLYATSLGTQHLRCEIEIPDRVVPLATRLKQHGYYCTTSGKTDYNFDPSGIWDQRTNDAAPWRRRENKDQPFFAFITVGETHEGPINHIDRFETATRDLPSEFRHDPADVTVPPFYPDSPEIRRIVAGMHDLASVFDRKVGELIQTLKEDGDFDNTILFVFGDHGNGLPRYKRWLNDSGLRVPLVVYVPPKYRSLAIPSEEMHQTATGQLETERLVSFVDFPATALSLAGIPIPDLLQGQAFLGQGRGAPRKFVFGARSRADDMYEVSRSVSDGRYIYVRHFMPHLPYIQPSVIFDDSKSSFKELRRLYRAGELDEHAARLWNEHKPMEELYDLQSDPHELNNLADAPEQQGVKKQLREELRTWILAHRDSGFMPESEYQIRSRQQGRTPFDIVENREQFDLESALKMASRVGTAGDLEAWKAGLLHPESAVRYWAAVGLLAASDIHSLDITPVKTDLLAALGDDSPCVAIAAAHTLLTIPDLPQHESRKTQLALSRLMLDDRSWVALEACRATTLLGIRARPLVPVMKQVVEANLAETGERRRYKDFNYASFTGWTLETSLRICGEEDYVDALYSDVIFEDDFAPTSQGDLKPNLVKEPPPLGMGYTTNTPEGYLLKNWIVADVEPNGKRRAFWAIPKRADGTIETYAEQAGRSRNSICFANARVPSDAERYVIEFRQWANDNDYIGFIVGASETVTNPDGVEIGYTRQLPGTDTTVRDIYYRSPWGRGTIAGEAKRRRWVQHRIEVDGNHIAWSQDGRVLLSGTVKTLKRGGFFGIRQTYERGTRYDDVRISVLKRSPPPELVRSNEGLHLRATLEDANWNAIDQKPTLPDGLDAFALLPNNRVNLARLEWWQAPPRVTSGELQFTVAVADAQDRIVDVACGQSGRKLGEVKVSRAAAMQTFRLKLTASQMTQAINEGVRLGLSGGDSPLWIVLKSSSANAAEWRHAPQLVLKDEFASTQSFPIRVAEQRRTLLDANDRPFVLRGRTAWYVLSLPPEEAIQLLDDTATKGFNAIEIKGITHDKNGNNPPFAGNGELPFHKRLDGTQWDGTFQGSAPDFASVNENYWSFVDNFLKECRERGIAVLFFPAYVGYDGGEQGWMQQMVANGPEKSRAYGQWIARRYREYDNLIWMIGGDYAKFKPAELKVEQALIDGMRSVPNQRSTVWSAEWESDLNACDHPTLGKFTNFNGVYSWENSITRCSRQAFAHQPMRPAFLLEEPYDEEGPDGSNYNPNATQPVRRFIYWGWLNTIGGYVAGNGYVWRCKPGWQDHLNSPGASDLAHLNKFIQSSDAARLLPSGLGGMRTLVVNGQGREDELDYIAAASTSDGKLTVIYASPKHAPTFSLDLRHLPVPGKARWWDPTSGEYQNIGTVAAEESVAFTPPGKNASGETDWVLRIDAN